jgi:uncharacterized protein YgbK (DUF1537 family)
MTDFYNVSVALPDAKAIAWDTCHKIYVLMDDAQVEKMREYEYDPLITKDEMNEQEMLDTIQKWYDESCGLRFVDAVSTNLEDPNAGFETLIAQGEDWEDEDDEDEE